MLPLLTRLKLCRLVNGYECKLSMGERDITLSQTSLVFTSLQLKSFENSVGN